MLTPLSAINAYIHAKGGNRPWLLRETFSESNSLDMVFETDAIAFPPEVTGREEVVEVLVGRFSREYENIYTFCLDSPPSETVARRYACKWLVGMSSRADGAVRVGCGRYAWMFEMANFGKIESITITIAAMRVLSAEHLNPIMTWLSNLPYPWCPADEAIRNMPEIPELSEIAGHISHNPCRQLASPQNLLQRQCHVNQVSRFLAPQIAVHAANFARHEVPISGNLS